MKIVFAGLFAIVFLSGCESFKLGGYCPYGQVCTFSPPLKPVEIKAADKK